MSTDERGSDGLTDAERADIAERYNERTTPTRKSRKTTTEWLNRKREETTDDA